MQYREFLEGLSDWGFASSRVYPVLLHAGEGKAMSKGAVSTDILDLSIAYTIRCQMEGGGYATAKVTEGMLESYGVSQEELHSAAMGNLKEDGYELIDLEQLILGMEAGMAEGGSQPVQGGLQEGRMYILRNASGMFGAAGILDPGLLRSVAMGRDCFVLPSSIHETILVPAAGWEGRQEELDGMVAEINATQVSENERLSDHSYYYDAQKGEVRIWA